MTGVDAREGKVEVTGGRIWYRVVGGGEEVPLVTVHGGPGGTHDYLEPLEALADERPVVFYDQLGAGKSDAPDDVSLWTNDRMIDELGRLLDALDLPDSTCSVTSGERSSRPSTRSNGQTG
jgi:proline iminopeptidase